MDKDTMTPENNRKSAQRTSHSEKKSDHEERAVEDSEERESRSGVQGAGTG